MSKKILKSVFVGLILLVGSFYFIAEADAATTTIFISSGTSWTVPSDWDDIENDVQVIGGGGGGTSATGVGGGGGGGAYSQSFDLDLTPSGSVTIQVGATGTPGVTGGDTWFNGATCAGASACAKGGVGGTGTAGGAGGDAASGVGTIKNSGGAGGEEGGSNTDGGGGGGAGPKGAGGAGGQGDTVGGGQDGGGGGGGNGGGAAGSNGGANGGAGGNNAGATGGGAGGNGACGDPGTVGGGGGGGDEGFCGGAGGSGDEFDASHGSGGGGGGKGNVTAGQNGGQGGYYGGGGGGGVTGGSGTQGLIVISYTPFVAENVKISGNAYEDDSGTTALVACDGATNNIKLIVATSTPGQYSTTCNDSTGAFTIDTGSATAPAASTTLIAYVDGSANTFGSAVHLYSGTTNFGGITIRASTTIIDYGGADGPIQTQDLDRWDNDNDTDLPYVVTAGQGLTFEQNTKWQIGTSTAAANAVNFIASSTASTTPGGTFVRGGDVQITSGSTLNMGTNNLTVGGNLMNFGTLTLSSGQTTTFNGARTGGNSFNAGSGFTFQHLTIGGSVPITASSSIIISGSNFTVNSGAILTVPSGINATTSSSFITLNGTINGAGTTTSATSAFTCFPSTGTLDSNIRIYVNNGCGELPARSYGANMEILDDDASDTKIKLLSGTHSITGSFLIRQEGTSDITINGATNNPTITIGGNLDYTGGGSGSEIIWTGTGGWTVTGNADFTAGTFTASSTNVFTMNGTSKTLTTNAQEFAGLTLSGTITTSGAVSATGPLVLSGSTISLGSTASTTGDSTLSGTVYPQQQPVILNGSSRTLTGGGTIGAVLVNGNYTLSGGGLTVGTTTIPGTLSVGSQVYTSTSTLTLSGTLNGSGTTTIQHSNLGTAGTLNSNVRFDATTASTTIPNRTYGGNLEVYSNSTSARGGLPSAGTYSLSKALILNAANTGNVTLDGGTNNITLTSATTTYIGSGSGNEVMTAGSNNWTFTGDLTTSNGTFRASSATTSVSGNYTNSGGLFVASNGVVLLNGGNQQTITGNATGSSAFYDLTITNSSGGGDATNSPSVIFANVASTTNTFFVTTANVTARFPAVGTSTFQNINWDGQGAGTKFKPRSSISGDRFAFRVPGSRFAVSRVDFMDADACDESPNIDATDGTSVDSGNNNCIDFAAAAAATIVSAANQVFEKSQAATAISQITVTAGSGSNAITAASDLRVAIATSSATSPIDMRWLGSDLTATIGGSQVCTVSSTVSYEGGDSVLLVAITGSDCNSGDTIIISDLSFTSFNTVAASTSGLRIYLDGATDQTANATNTAQYVAIKGKQTLAGHAVGQEVNKLDIEQTTFANAELFSFKLTPQDETASTTQFVFTLSDIKGITCSDINLSGEGLFIDYNSNGDVDGSDVATGTPTCSISGTSGSLTVNTTLSTSTARDFILRADLSNIEPEDKMTISLTAANVTCRGVTSNQSLTTSGSANPANQFRGSRRGGGAGVPGEAGSTGVTTGGTGQGGGTGVPGETGGTGQTGGGTGQGGGGDIP